MPKVRISYCLLVLLCSLSLGAVTLEKLSLEEMIDSSTMIVRGTVSESSSSRDGALIRTEYRISVTETLKGSAGTGSVAVSLPGGSVDGSTQTFAGMPSLRAGEEYVFFLWSGKSGRLQLVGLTQGLLRISRTDGAETASRPPIDGTLLDRRSGRAVRDRGMDMRLPALRETVTRRVRASNGGRH